MKFTSFNEFSITSLFKLLMDCNDFHWYKCLKTIFIGTVRNNQIWFFCALNILNKFSQQRNIEGWIVQIFVVIGGFALFFKEMSFSTLRFMPKVNFWQSVSVHLTIHPKGYPLTCGYYVYCGITKNICSK